MSGKTNFEELGASASGCRKCALSDTRIQVVFGSGDPGAEVMLVGEAPGRTEDEGGLPFSGAAGKILDEALHAARLKRSDVYITSVLKCRPPKNRNPKPEEIESCAPWLDRQIEFVDPRVIVLLGTFGARRLLGTREPITAIRGKGYVRGGRILIPVFHPAAAIYDRSKLEVLFEDFEHIGDLVREDLQ